VNGPYFIILAGTPTHLRGDHGMRSSVHSVRAVWSVTRLNLRQRKCVHYWCRISG